MATIKDVAKEAGVSIATVSYVINKKRHINPDTAQRVIEAIKKLNYRPSMVARSLVTKSSKLIGLLISDITNNFYTPIVRGVEDEANQSGYTIIISNSDENLSKTEKYLTLMQQHSVDGLLVAPTSGFEKLIPVIESIGLPMVLVNRSLESTVYDMVTTDNELGAYTAVKYLCGLGHESIGLVVGPTEVSTYADRLKGYKKALDEFGIPVNNDLIRIGGYFFDSGFRLTNELLELKLRPSAIFIGSGPLSGGAYKAIKNSGVSIPRDLSVISFDENEWASFVEPTITTVAQKTYEMGRHAARELINRIEESQKDNAWWEKPTKQTKPQIILRLNPELIIRDSTGPVRS